MSEMRVPVTDAFDNTDQLEALEVELTPRQVEWLERKADERGLSIDHMLRSIITAQIRGLDVPPSSSATSGDGAPPSSSDDPAPAGDDDSPSIVESLRSASKRLQDLTEDEDSGGEGGGSDLSDTLARLQARTRGSSDREASSTEGPGTVLLDNENRSMFDMMEE